MIKKILLTVAFFIAGFSGKSQVLPETINQAKISTSTASVVGSTCSNPIVVNSFPYCDTSNTAIYGNNIGFMNPGSSCGSDLGPFGAVDYFAGNDVVYAYTAAFTGTISISMTPDEATYTGIFAYTNCIDIGTACIAGAGNTASTERNIPFVSVTAGQTIYIVISGNSAMPFDYSLTIQKAVKSSCAKPVSVSTSAIADTGADISWLNGSGSTATSWEVAVQTAGAMIPSGVGIVANTNTNYHVETTVEGTSLTAATDYQYWVRASCGDDTFSTWAGPFFFTTANCPLANQCNYTFTLNNTSGSGWYDARMQVIQNGQIVTTLGASFTDEGPLTISVPLCDGVPFQLFWNRGGQYPSIPKVSIRNSLNQELYYMPGGSEALVGTTLYSGMVDCINPACLSPIQAPFVTSSAITYNSALINWGDPLIPPTGWQVYIVPHGTPAPEANTLASYTLADPTSEFTIPVGDLQPDTKYTVYIRATCAANGPGAWTIGTDFTTKEFCFKPTALNVSGITPFGANLVWTNPTGTAWQYIVLPNGSPVPTAATPGWIATTSNTVNPITGLLPESVFQYYVRTDCGTIFSNPAGPKTFTTAIACPKPTALTATNTTSSGATFSWTSSSATAWQVLVLPQGSPAPTADVTGWIAVSSNSYIYDNPSLTPDTCYSYYVRSDCGGINGLSSWSGPRNFCTTAACYKPTFFSISTAQITTNSVLLTWSTAIATTAWQVLALPAGSPAPTADATGWQDTNGGSSSGPRSYNYNGLTSQTSYDFYIRGNCGGAIGVTSWVGPRTATTMTYCFTPSGLTATNITPYSTQLEWGDNNSPSSNQWQIIVSPAGTPAPAVTDIGTIVNTNHPVVNGLIPETCYQYHVRSACGGLHGNSVWAGPYNFCSNRTCLTPTNLMAENTSSPVSTLSWTELNGNTQWEVVAQSMNGPVPNDNATGIMVTGTATFDITILQPGVYEFYVRSYCSETQKSEWGGPFTFNKLASSFNCTTVNFTTLTPTSGSIDLCPGENCVDLSASYPDIKDTSTYTVKPLIFNPPFPFTGGTLLPIEADDYWSYPLTLPFEFCFFGTNYTTFHVGSNGVLTFTPQESQTVCPWNTEPGHIIPDTDFPILNAIYGVYQDIDPSVNTAPIISNVNYTVVGTAPCRIFVLNYFNLATYQCQTNVPLQTSQIVLYENSNVIEVYVKDRTICETWNDGLGVIGIQNATGTSAYAPYNRNLGNWETHNEAWQFIPDGLSSATKFSWLKDGVFYSDIPSVNVCISETTNITAQTQYTSCTGVVTAVTNNVLFNVIETAAPTGMANQTVGANATLENLAVNGQDIQWYSSLTNGTPLAPNTILENGLTYYASQTISGCESADRLPVTVEVLLSNAGFNAISYSYSPNPVDDVLNIKSSEKLKAAKVCNLLGQVLMHQKFDSNEITLTMNRLPTGTYVVLIESENRKETFKIVKE